MRPSLYISKAYLLRFCHFYHDNANEFSLAIWRCISSIRFCFNTKGSEWCLKHRLYFTDTKLLFFEKVLPNIKFVKYIKIYSIGQRFKSNLIWYSGEILLLLNSVIFGQPPKSFFKLIWEFHSLTPVNVFACHFWTD